MATARTASRIALALCCATLVACASSSAPTQNPSTTATVAQPVQPVAQTIGGIDPDATDGFLSVTSEPTGEVYLNGQPTGAHTPTQRLAVPPGNVDVQVRFANSRQLSSPNSIVVRAGVHSNLFFRERPGTSEDHDDAAETREQDGER